MSIQQGVNQLFRDAGYMATLGKNIYMQSDTYQNKKTAEGYQKEFEGAKSSLEHMYKNLQNQEKAYDKEDLSNIRDRGRGLIKRIYDIKVAEEDPRYNKYIDTSALKHNTIKQSREDMDTEINRRLKTIKDNEFNKRLNDINTSLNTVEPKPQSQNNPNNGEVPLLPAPEQYPQLPEKVAIPQGPIGGGSPEARAYYSMVQNAKAKLDARKRLEDVKGMINNDIGSYDRFIKDVDIAKKNYYGQHFRGKRIAEDPKIESNAKNVINNKRNYIIKSVIDKIGEFTGEERAELLNALKEYDDGTPILGRTMNADDLISDILRDEKLKEDKDGTEK